MSGIGMSARSSSRGAPGVTDGATLAARAPPGETHASKHFNSQTGVALAQPDRVNGDPVSSHATIVEQGVKRCTECGKPHDCRRRPGPSHEGVTWADPSDGHSYRSESWEHLAREYLAKFGPLPSLPPQ